MSVFFFNFCRNIGDFRGFWRFSRFLEIVEIFCRRTFFVNGRRFYDQRGRSSRFSRYLKILKISRFHKTYKSTLNVITSWSNQHDSLFSWTCSLCFVFVNDLIARVAHFIFNKFARSAYIYYQFSVYRAPLTHFLDNMRGSAIFMISRIQYLWNYNNSNTYKSINKCTLPRV